MVGQSSSLYPVGVKVVSPCGFNLHLSLMTTDVENLFMCVLAICISYFVRSVQFFFLLIFIKLLVFLLLT